MKLTDESDIEGEAVKTRRSADGGIRDCDDTSPAPWIEDLEIACRSEAAVLVTAERYLWRLYVAQTLHERSGRRAHRLVIVDPTRADQMRTLDDWQPVLLAASGGTIYVDTIESVTDLRGLHFLAEYCAERRDHRVTPRLITGATSTGIRSRLRSGTFPEQLFYRLNTIHLTV